MRTLTSLLVLSAALTPAAARDWPQWRGPFFNGSTDETDLPTHWSPTENVKWVTAMPGRAYSTPVVCRGRVFATSTGEGNDLIGLCVDEATGKILWSKKLAVGYANMAGKNQASPSPVADGKRVYFLFGNGVLVAMSYAGEIVWHRDLVREYGPLGTKWGYSSSPLLWNGKLYVVNLRAKEVYRGTLRPGQTMDSYLLCLDPATGKTLYRHIRPTHTKGEDRETYATPIPAPRGTGSEILLVGGDHLTGHDADTGKELWRWNCNPRGEGIWRRVVPSPVVGEKMIYMIRSQDRPQHRPLYAVPRGLTGTIPHKKYAWRFPAPDDQLGTGMTTDVCTPLLYKGRLYVLSDRRKTLACLHPETGKVIWYRLLGGRSIFRASPTGADGKIYCINMRGQVVVVAASDTFKLVATTDMKGGTCCMSTIVPANGHLFIRTQGHLYCIGK